MPATTFWERNDVHTPWAGAGHYAIYMKQAIRPMYECRDDRDLCRPCPGAGDHGWADGADLQ
jgi:anaerobic selenocysteine-containing dehydrogenase